MNRLFLLGLGIFLISVGSAWSEPSEVTVQREGESASLLFNGKPFEVKGVGGDGDLELFKSTGGNAIRTWGIDENTGKILDAAHAQGIKVALGYWLGHERHGFDYSDWDSIISQADGLFEAVEKYKNHPALLLWAIGNEMEGFNPESNPAIYTQIEYLAKRVKEIDPNHPTMTVTAEIGKRQIEGLNRFCPSIDIHGINSYGGVTSIPERYREKGGVKPYLITEYGPAGTWEVPKNKWGMSDEKSSTDKASSYKAAYEAVHADPLCLGSFAFTWGAKQEASATWFGMLLPSGEKTACVDELTKLWSGEDPENFCPEIHSLELVGDNVLFEQGQVIEVKLDVSDPEGDELEVKWVLSEDWKEAAEGGDHRPTPPTYPELILPESTNAMAKIKLPNSGETYRVYAFVYDGQGGGASANLSINVKGERKAVPASKLELPLSLTGAGKTSPWVPSGWMGDTDKLKLEEDSTENPREGKSCTKVSFTDGSGWGGVVWQHPAGDWGDSAGGFDLTGAKSLSFWARGSEGGEKVTVGIGIIGSDKKYYDSVRKHLKLNLTKDWVKYEIDLSQSDLTRVKSALYFSTSAEGKPFSFYLDEVSIQ
ncbi:MAG: glycoside hydrolase family 2 TIM barrel-domain containing protein [Verrucomicrobiota bacterium]